ncbi:FecCD family ABC transporter permease [Rhodomicrobium lacus]|uniref:FecCD family ABC transporter permease n=1 Tax=Rhodomicrobium lacus TaxID=2498452 RepID=UPI000F8D1369|nr:iron ABC transporter permease [Rhodomicrobium lacus]
MIGRGIPVPGWLFGCIVLMLAMTVLALSVGAYPIRVSEILHFLAATAGLTEMDPARRAVLSNVLVDVRLPRVLAAILVGMALACSGAAFQAVFRNPLVSPGLLGVLAGAAFGAALGMVLDGSWALIQLLCFVMGLAAVAVGVGVATSFGGASMITLVLGGVISSAMFGALLSIIKYVADPQNQLPSIVYWMMGNLGMPGLEQTLWLAGPIIAGIISLALLGRGLDALSMGDDEARALGIPVDTLRYAVIVIATLLSAITVSMVGMIGWVGLFVPHAARILLGPGNRRLLIASALLGASFLLAADFLARMVASAEIPIGIVTECLGIPMFLLVLRKARRGWAA